MAMRWLAMLGGSVALMACSAINPDYGPEQSGMNESTGPPPDPVGTSDDSVGTQGPQTSGASGTSSPTDGPGASSSSDDGGPPRGSCEADLYAVNEQGKLYLVDVDSATAVVVGKVPASSAIATDPSSGTVYISSSAEPGNVAHFDPVTLDLFASTVVPGNGWPVFGRAAHDHLGRLWLGAQVGGRFVVFEPGQLSFMEWTVDSFPNGGDLVMIGDQSAEIVVASGTAYVMAYGGMISTLTPSIDGVPPGVALSGLAIDVQDRLWVSAAGPDGLLLRVQADADTIGVIQSIQVGVLINDLAPVVQLPEGC